MYFQRHVIFTWNPRYVISNLIYVDSTTVYKRMSTRKSTWILCCLFTWHRREFYELFLSGIKQMSHRMCDEESKSLIVVLRHLYRFVNRRHLLYVSAQSIINVYGWKRQRDQSFLEYIHRARDLLVLLAIW